MNNGGLGNKGVRDTVTAAGFSLASRNRRSPGGKPREWGMLFYLVDTVTPANTKRFELKYNQASTNLYDNSNWVEFTGGGGGGTTTIKSQTFAFAPGNTGEFTVSNGTIDQLLFVEALGDFQIEGTNYTRTGQLIDFGAALPGSGNFTAVYAEALSLVKPDYKADYKTVGATAYTIVEGDLGKTLLFTNPSAILITIPVGLTVGFQCIVRRRNGSGVITYQGDGVSTIETSGLIQNADNSSVFVQHFGANVYGLEGNLI